MVMSPAGHGTKNDCAGEASGKLLLCPALLRIYCQFVAVGRLQKCDETKAMAVGAPKPDRTGRARRSRALWSSRFGVGVGLATRNGKLKRFGFEHSIRAKGSGDQSTMGSQNGNSARR
jgi:hypothetical protein